MKEVLRGHLGLDSRQARLRTAELFESVGLAEPDILGKRYPYQLSGRYAATGDDCHGFGVQSGFANSGRADHKSRRYHRSVYARPDGQFETVCERGYLIRESQPT